MTRLLVEDLLMLCWDDESGRPRRTQEPYLSPALCAALTFDAVVAGVVTVVDGRHLVHTGVPTDDPLLAGLVTEIGRHRHPARMRKVLESELAFELPTLTMHRLIERGVFRLEIRRKLRVFPSPRVWIDQPDEVEATRRAVTDVLTGRRPGFDVEAHVLLLTVLSRPIRAVGMLVPRGTGRQVANRRVDDLSRGDGIPAAFGLLDQRTMRAVITELNAAIARRSETSSATDG